MRDGDRGYSAVYGPYRLCSAFQPIFRSAPDGGLRLVAFEGLLRPSQIQEDVSPTVFFAAVTAGDRAGIDALCRRLHLLNMGLVNRPEAALFLNFDPSLLRDVTEGAREAARIAAAAAAIGLTGRQIVCEITEKAAVDADALLAMTDTLRAHGFRIAVDDFGAADSDMLRIEQLRPDIVKFDGAWVLRYLMHAAGVEILTDLVTRFRKEGITTLFEGLEEVWQIDLCQEIGSDLLQGFALARPAAPSSLFNERFPPEPEFQTRGARTETGEPPPVSPVAAPAGPPAARPFGRREN